MVTTRVTVLVENTAKGPGILAEHGMSYWIEQDNNHVLMDTGQGGALERNALRLGIRLAEINALILSHGHYDHTGGAPIPLKSTLATTIYLHPAAFARKYTRESNGTVRDIGIPRPSEEAIRNSRHQIVESTQPITLFNHLTMTGPVPRVTDFEDTGGQFFLDKECFQPDPLEDDQSVFFDTREGLVVLLGCAHAGLINTLLYIRHLTNNRPIHMVIGGTHLINASPQRMERTLSELRGMGVRKLAPAHCTGMPATVALWNAFPGQCHICPVGTQFEFE